MKIGPAGEQGPEPGGLRRLAGEVLVVLPAFLAARLIVGAAFVLAFVAADHLVPDDRPPTLEQGLTAWDGQWYEGIAAYGYEGIPLEGVRFFPLFPLAGRWLDVLLPGGVGLALVVVANLFALVFAVVARRLVVHETRDPGLASLTTWTLAVFPASFVLVWGYAESMMLAAAAGTLLALRRKHWLAAGLFGALAALARPLGAFLALSAALEGARGIASASPRERVERGVAVAGPLLGLGAYLAWVGARFDDAFLPLTVQEEFRGPAQDPLRRILDGLGDLVGPEALGDGLHIPFAVGFVALLLLGLRHWPVSFTVFAAAVLVSSLGADNLNSLERYGLNAFPIVLTLAVVTRRWGVERVVLTVSAAGMLALCALASLGPYVP